MWNERQSREGRGDEGRDCSLWTECYGQTPLVYTEMADRSRTGEGVYLEGGRSRMRADPDQMKVREGHG